MNKINQLKSVLDELLKLIEISQEQGDQDLEQLASIHFDLYKRTMDHRSKLENVS